MSPLRGNIPLAGVHFSAFLAPVTVLLHGAKSWLLSDVGLGWTRFKEVGPGWTEPPAVKRHLPADILLRPEPNGPWDCEFALANGAVLWVKPGRQKQTFRWGVRAPKKSAEHV